MGEIDNMPLYELQTLYYTFWREREEEKKLTPEQKQSVGLARALGDF